MWRTLRAAALAALAIEFAGGRPAIAADGAPASFADQQVAGLATLFATFTKQELERKSFLAQGTAGVDPFISNDASAVIARPSMSQLFDTAVDFNNEEATFGLRVSPALLVTPFPDWYLTGLSLIGSANTDEKSFAFGGKWDLNFRDPRLYFALHHQEVEDEFRRDAVKNCGPSVDIDAPDAVHEAFEDCWAQTLDATVTRYEERYRQNPFAFSAGGNASYDNNGDFGGGNATLAVNASQLLAEKIHFVLTANAKYEDALPSDAEFDEIKKQTMMPSLANDERNQKIGGGLELALKRGLGGENGNERSIELGFGAAALGCLGGACEQLSDGSSIKLNPFLALALTKTLGGRVDVFWDGTGSTLGDAIAGVSFKYAFRGLDDPLGTAEAAAAAEPRPPE